MNAEEPSTGRNRPASLELSGGGGVLIVDPFSGARAAMFERKRRAKKLLVD